MGKINEYAEEWKRLERGKPAPLFVKNIIEIEYSEFEYQVKNQDHEFVKKITDSFYSGDSYLLKNAFPSKFLEELKSRLMDYSRKFPSSFYQMKEGCPDFHRLQSEVSLGKYSVDAIRHSFYFFPWNDDPLGIRETFYEKWKIIKFVSWCFKNFSTRF